MENEKKREKNILINQLNKFEFDLKDIQEQIKDLKNHESYLKGAIHDIKAELKQYKEIR